MRKFVCPFCGFVHNFSPKDTSKFQKRVIGFVCPGCGRKPTEADLAKKRGAGPKPKAERRKRVKKEVVKDTSPVVVHPYVEQFEWRTGGPLPPGETRRYGSNAEWQPKPLQPTTRTLEEALVEDHLAKMAKESSKK